MDLSFPLRSLVPSLDSAVLEVLAGTESALSATQIARLAGRGTRQGQALVLDRLILDGLVLAEPANRGYLYRLNRNHLLADPVLIAVRARVSLLHRLSATVPQLLPRVMHASLFGTFARREAGPMSDIDLLVVFPAADPSADSRAGAMQELADLVLSWTGNRLECLAFNLDELQRVVADAEPIVQAWRTDSIHLVGAPLETVLAVGDTRRARPRR